MGCAVLAPPKEQVLQMSQADLQFLHLLNQYDLFFPNPDLPEILQGIKPSGLFSQNWQFCHQTKSYFQGELKFSKKHGKCTIYFPNPISFSQSGKKIGQNPSSIAPKVKGDITPQITRTNSSIQAKPASNQTTKDLQKNTSEINCLEFNEIASQRIIILLFFEGKPLLTHCRLITKHYAYDGPLNQEWLPEGRGTMWNKTAMYEGQFRRGFRQGEGHCYSVKKNWGFKGILENGLYIHGCLELPQGKYEGPFLNEMYHGHGKYTWNGGGQYEGQFQNGMKHGKGILYNADGELVRRGKWFNDKMLP